MFTAQRSQIEARNCPANPPSSKGRRNKHSPDAQRTHHMEQQTGEYAFTIAVQRDYDHQTQWRTITKNRWSESGSQSHDVKAALLTERSSRHSHVHGRTNSAENSNPLQNPKRQRKPKPRRALQSALGITAFKLQRPSWWLGQRN